MADDVERILTAIAALPGEERRRLLQRLGVDEGALNQAALALDFSAGELDGAADIVIIFDGGSRGNPGAGYGSYALVEPPAKKPQLVRLDFGRKMTNNEAEYESLIAALDGLIEQLVAAGRSPEKTSVEIRGDSALVIHQVEGSWKTKDDRMRLLRNRCRQLLSRFRAHRLVLHGREESVRILGH